MYLGVGVIMTLSFVLFNDFIYLILERGERREKERERNINLRDTSISCLSYAPKLGTWPATQACVLTGNWTSDLLVHKPVLNPLSHTSQG